ncbi:Haloacid dehalogenase-like hydrolase domain protein [mine drainage metagenome]|uniref:Haloacid dehalogenase-like hydrolase domain protein n=1 Tax=mine drainage metagenome TaxID=410659 RepID=T1BDK3_9ZZZZ
MGSIVDRPSHEPVVIFFDLDDTIFDHSRTCRAALGELRRAEPRFRSMPLDRLWRRYLERLGETDLTLGYARTQPAAYEAARAARFLGLAEEAGWSATPADGERLSALYRAHYQRRRRAIPGAIPLVRTLAREHPVGVITNNQVAEQEEKLRFLGLREFVAPLVVSEAVGAEKPDPTIFRHALRAAGVAAARAVMVGDSWSNDVLGARAVGMHPVWFNRFGASAPTRHRVPVLRSFSPAPAVASLLRGLPGR